MSRIVLASKSPRRVELLGNIISDFAVRPAPDCEKTGYLDPELLVLANAYKKAHAIAAPGDIVISADTVVYLDGKILEKPADEADAFKMLSTLSGRTHEVYTGVVIAGEKELCFCEKTSVTFRTLDEALIKAYIATGHPMDKAGAYGIQGEGAFLVESICGDYYNVMGLPVCRLVKNLQQMGVKIDFFE